MPNRFSDDWRTLDGAARAASWVDGSTLGAPPPSTDADVPSLPRIALSGEPTAPAALELGARIGEGALGLVLEGRQPALDRSVAVKCLRADRRTPEAAAMLVREARVAGRLEHPNVVPVHALGRDAAGQPLLVMTRVDGVSWRALLADDTPLERHLEILGQVCHALHYAHSRGVLHRDVKPDNVMVGRFGEVYLVDWGLAVAAEGARTEALVGTPGYLPPEMVRPGAPLDARADVFMLGAVLHEVVTGRRLQAGSSLAALVEAAHRCAPPPLTGVPDPLAALVRRAVAADPGERFASAEAFRDALVRSGARRESDAVTDRALRELEALLAADDPEARFGACRFGFGEALRLWPENTRAIAGLQRALEHMVEHDLARGEALAAERLLRELPAPRPELAARVGALTATQQAEQVELTRLRAAQRDGDPRAGAAARRALFMLFVLLFGLGPILSGRLRAVGVLPADVEPMRRAVAPLVGALLILAFARFGRARLLDSGYNRRVLALALVALLMGTLTWYSSALLGDDLRAGFARILVLGAGCLGAAAATFDRRLALPAGVFAVAAVVGSTWPTVAEETLGAANVLALGAFAVGERRLVGERAPPR